MRPGASGLFIRKRTRRKRAEELRCSCGRAESRGQGSHGRQDRPLGKRGRQLRSRYPEKRQGVGRQDRYDRQSAQQARREQGKGRTRKERETLVVNEVLRRPERIG